MAHLEKTRTREVIETTSAGTELLTLQQASKLLKVHPNTLRNWEKSGVIPVVRVGPRRDRRFPKHGLHKFLPKEYAALAAREGTETARAVAAAPVSVEEAKHVIVNVPPKLFSQRALVTAGVVIAGILLLLAQIGSRDATTDFAIRRNPPKVLFADDFEVYDVGALPRPIWNTFGIWKVVRENGQRFLRGEEGPDNPIGVLSHVYTGASPWSDYKLKFDAKIVSGRREIIALVDYLDEQNYYAVKFSEAEVEVTLVKHGEVTLLGKSPVTGWDPTVWHTFAVDLYGNDIDVIFDGDRVLGIANAALTSGKVGFAAQDQVVDLDHVQVVETPSDARPAS